MKMAIVHEWYGSYGGAEETLLQMAESCKFADLYVLKIDKDVPLKKSNEAFLKESWYAKFVGSDNRALAAILSPLVFRTLTMKKYDLVVSSSHTFAHTAKIINSRDTKYLSYVYTPSRTLWTPEIDSRGVPDSLGGVRRPLRFLDNKLGSHVDSYAAISSEVQSRIFKFWNRTSSVIHPPVRLIDELINTQFPKVFPYKEKEYLISAGRLVKYKRHDFAIDVAEELGKPLVILGNGPEEMNLRKKADSSKFPVLFVTNADRQQFLSLLKGSNCLIFPSHEDFGIVPVEALSLGVPVVAFSEGGVRDYVKDKINGFLISELSVELFAEAVDRINFSPISLAESVKNFSAKRFRHDFQFWITEQTGYEFHDES